MSCLSCTCGRRGTYIPHESTTEKANHSESVSVQISAMWSGARSDTEQLIPPASQPSVVRGDWHPIQIDYQICRMHHNHDNHSSRHVIDYFVMMILFMRKSSRIKQMFKSFFQPTIWLLAVFFCLYWKLWSYPRKRWKESKALFHMYRQWFTTKPLSTTLK